jgi:ATP-dependent DNA helicase RecG
MTPPTPPTFERSPVQGAEVDDLHRERLESYIRRRVPSLAEEMGPERLGVTLGLLGNTGGRLVPTVAGFMLFGVFPQVVRPEWGVSAVRVHGTTLADPVAQRADLEGNLPDLLHKTLGFVEEQSRDVASLSRHGESEPEYPDAAVREAVLNALVHRDYRLPGRVAVRIFDDRLEVWSPGGIPVPLSLDHVTARGGVSFPKNPVLAAGVRALGLMEQVGRGLPVIRRALAEVTGAPVRLVSSQSDFLAILPSRHAARAATDEPGN